MARAGREADAEDDAAADDGPDEGDSEGHLLEVTLRGADVVDVVLDGERLWPIWFKLEFKETGQVSAKVAGVRLSTRLGDRVVIHHLPEG